MTRTSQLNFRAGPNPDPAYRWDAKRKLFIPVKGSAPLSVVLVLPVSFLNIFSPYTHLLVEAFEMGSFATIHHS